MMRAYLLSALALLLSSPAAAELPPVVCEEGVVCREQITGLPLMALPRSFSSVYGKRDFSEIVIENIPAFEPLYVFSRELPEGVTGDATELGRYQVARTEQGPPLGWMAAADLLEWRQALTAAYTHPGSGEEARQRVLMFRRLDDLQALVADDERELKALDFYERIDRGDVPQSLLSKEPEAFVDIGRTFYLLPVVDFRLLDLEGDDLRLVRVASALPGERAPSDQPDRLDNPDYLRRAQQGQPDQERVKALRVDLVFVIDMTLSMQPYLDRTKDAIAAIARRIAEGDLAERIRFGLVGFRDDVAKAPALEFTRRNFTPELLDTEGFVKILTEDAKAATVSSPGYSEEVFAGVEEALASNWRDNSLRFLILVGDASGHPPDHPQSTTKKDAKVLRMAAQDMNVHVLAIQLLNPKFPADQPVAEAQFGQLSMVRGGSDSALLQVRTDAVEDYQQAVERIAGRVADTVKQVRDQGASGVDLAGGAPADDSIASQADRAMQKVIRSAMVEYLGQDAKPPRDILAWAADRDLTNPSVRSLEVRVLLTRDQLSDLILALERILAAMQAAKVSNMEFFDALQGLAAQSMKRPEELARLDSVRQAGLVPSFIESLPYRSEVLSLDRESYTSLTADQRADLNQRLIAKLSQYRKISETVDGWTRLNPEASGGRPVYPLQLDYLP